jgi:gliding motility-associated-like protein
MAPYTYQLLYGSLPAGVSIAQDGKIVGKPEVAGTFTFTVEVTEGSACKNVSTATYTMTVNEIKADQVDVHPVITPNGDGINDFLSVTGIEKYPENHLVIVNRNGTTVFEIRNYDNAENVFKGKANHGLDYLPEGTYFYMLEFKLEGKWKRKNGYLVLKYE